MTPCTSRAPTPCRRPTDPKLQHERNNRGLPAPKRLEVRIAHKAERKTTLEKTIWLFHRVDQRSPSDFAQHYVEHHAILGRALCRMVLGYTVNIVDRDGPNAVTEHWVDNVVDFLDPKKNYDSPEDRKRVFEDDQTLIDHSKTSLYLVEKEVVVVAGAPLDTPFGSETPESKVVVFYRDASDIPAPPPSARRVVDNVVSHALTMADRGRVRIPSDIAVIRMIWGMNAEEIGTEDALSVKEYRQIAAPHWP